MKDLGKIVLHIPAREGSKRVPKKNIRLMNNRPMISYTIDASIKANITKEMYVNTDDTEIIDYVLNTYPDFKSYKRDKKLADDKASSEDFNYDIIKNLNADTLIMINPVCPVVTVEDIMNAFNTYKNSDCDTLITSSSTQMQTFCNGKPINIKIDEPLAPSQDNEKISILNWAITIWDAKKFMERIETKGYGSLGENRILFDIDPLHAIKVSEEKDFLLAEKLLQIKV